MLWLSIVIPSYNYGRFLAAAIDSIESNPGVEIVVVDNASTDNTADLRSRFDGRPGLRWVRNEKLLPVQDNWNKAVALAEAPWIKLLPADDIMLPGAVARLLYFIQNVPDAGYHAHLARVIDREGVVLRNQMPYVQDAGPLLVGCSEALRLKLRQVTRLKEPTCNIFRKEIWRQVGGYDKTLRFPIDLALNIELMARARGCFWSEHLVGLRRHAGSDGAGIGFDLAIQELQTVIGRIHLLQGADCTKADLRAGLAWLQYRVFELAAMKVRRRPAEVLKSLARHWHLVAKFWLWPLSLRVVLRRALTGDVQRTISRRSKLLLK
jgi:glycosyltransferase involved in cell wall biosynthesis